MPAILFKLLRNPYAIGVLAVILVGGIQQGRVWKSHAEMSACKSGLSAQREAWAEAQAAGEKAARAAVEAAVAEEAARQAERMAQEREAAQRLAEAAREAQERAEDWQRRYREAVRTDPSCAAWQAAPVECPL
jgi:hypothetical protein